MFLGQRSGPAQTYLGGGPTFPSGSAHAPKVRASTRDGVRALAERQGVTMDVAIRRMTALAERELRFADLKVAMAASSPDDSYLAEPADWESEVWS